MPIPLARWESKAAPDIKEIVNTWIELFDYYKIPTQMLDNLYFRSFDMRTRITQDGKKPPELNAELLCLNWTGQHGLKAELDNLRVEEIRQANPNSRFVNDGKLKCHYCYGSGFREVSRFGYRGVIRCQHEENYTLTSGDEIVGGDEGIEIIKLHLAKRGIEFEGNAAEFANVVRGAFG